MLTLRAMDENGKWLPKSKNVYALDENGNRIRTPNGIWKRVKVDTVDWNERKYGEIWRQDWAAAQNAALEAAGRAERVDMRSLERQGVEEDGGSSRCSHQDSDGRLSCLFAPDGFYRYRLDQ